MRLSVEEVESGVRRLRMRSWRGALMGYDVSAYLLGDLLIDTGFPRGGGALLDAVETLRPRGVVVTHWHEDHAGNAAALAARGVPIVMDARCEMLLRERPAIRFYRRVVWGRSARLTAPLVGLDPAPLVMMETPGHSPDHLGVWDAERRILVSGDLFLGVKVRVAHRHERPRALLASLRTAAALEPRLLLDAHRGPLTDPANALRAKAAWLEETIERVSERAARGDHPRAIARRVLGRESAIGYVSAGEYSKIAFVRAVLEEQAEDAPA